jgi:predicted nucleotidyltransferase
MIVDVPPPASQRIPASSEQISAFCHRWKITELALFGSVLRDDFRADSDIDILLTFSPDSRWSLFDWVDMKDELETLLQRQVDIVDKEGLKNPSKGDNQPIVLVS